MKLLKRSLHRASAAMQMGCVTLLLVAHMAFAQSASSLTGTVLDAKGNAVTNATIHIIAENGGATDRTTASDSQGRFTISDLPVGRYSVEAASTGFTTIRKAGVSVSGGTDC